MLLWTLKCVFQLATRYMFLAMVKRQIPIDFGMEISI